MFDTDRLNGAAKVHEKTTRSAAEESNHRIANNLALVSSLVRMRANAVLRQSEPLLPEEVAAMLKEIAQRIEGVSKLHRLLATGPAHGQIAAGPFLAEVCSGVAGSFASSQEIAFRDHSDAIEVAPERLNAMALFLAEGLTNAFKHSHPAGAPGRIEVTFAAVAKNGMRLAIQDDGVGLPDGFDPKEDGGLGLRIMRSLSEQLGGAISIKANPFGLCVGLDAPTELKSAVHAA